MLKTENKPSEQIRGKTVRLSWTDGPTQGTTQEHVFHQNGTVEWHSVGSRKQDKAQPEAEKPPYSAVKVTADICLMSYLSKSGYTLTVALNFKDHTTTGIASNDKTWFPVRGTFEIMK